MNRDQFSVTIGAIQLRIVVWKYTTNRGADGSLLEKSISEGENPARRVQSSVYGAFFESHILWEWNAKRVVIFI